MDWTLSDCGLNWTFEASHVQQVPAFLSSSFLGQRTSYTTISRSHPSKSRDLPGCVSRDFDFAKLLAMCIRHPSIRLDDPRIDVLLRIGSPQTVFAPPECSGCPQRGREGDEIRGWREGDEMGHQSLVRGLLGHLMRRQQAWSHGFSFP